MDTFRSVPHSTLLTTSYNEPQGITRSVFVLVCNTRIQERAWLLLDYAGWKNDLI